MVLCHRRTSVSSIPADVGEHAGSVAVAVVPRAPNGLKWEVSVPAGGVGADPGLPVGVVPLERPRASEEISRLALHP